MLLLLARLVKWRHIQFFSIADTGKSEINLISRVIATLIEKEFHLRENFREMSYCAFQKHANSEDQKPPSQLRFPLLSIIITITINEP